MIWLLVVVTGWCNTTYYNMNDDDMVACCRSWLM